MTRVHGLLKIEMGGLNGASQFLVIMAVAVCISVAGCAHVKTLPPRQEWAGLNVRLALPAGKWNSESLSGGHAVMFTRAEKPGHLLLVRVPRRNGPGWLALKTLLLEFREPREAKAWLESSVRVAPVWCGEYAVILDGRIVNLRACAFSAGPWTYDLAEWGSDQPQLEAVLASISFSGVRAPQEGP